MPNSISAPANPALPAVLSALAATEPDQLARLIDWLRIPSVSTDPAHCGDCRRAAEWAAAHLRASGITAELIETGDIAPDAQGQLRGSGHPIVLATTPPPPGGWAPRTPHVLFYGHSDVQPADPIDLWHSAPFEPARLPAQGTGPHAVGERLVARGAVDDKGQVACFLEAVRAWTNATGTPAGGARLTVLIESEEESGSVNLERFVRDHAARLRADVCLISDTGMLGRGRPAITYGVRGLVYTEVVLHAADQDLHSGLWGGKCPNPISELTKVLAQLWDSDRRVTIPGFYDAVRPLTESERAGWRGLGVDEAASLRAIGLAPEASVGERGFTFIEREWGRPTAELNGIVGGYTGVGAKTVIPAKASAKVSFRLVADQDPAAIRAAFFDWLRARTPAGCRWELIDHGGGFGVTTPTDSTLLRSAVRALKAAGATMGITAEPALIKSGGSIPVAGLLKSALGLDTIFMGFGLEDDRVHSPNEKFELECYRLGVRSHAAFIAELLAAR